ncbi:MAG: VWA domain-containing protein, partial [Nocardioidaceae bacterium]|nr:VWA domain-containing protein [Nocardioidaceae bacterium]
GLDGMGTGQITINGVLDATGKRGCGDGNDSAGGGAGGTIFVVAQTVTIGATAVITSAGGLGGDTQSALSGGECPMPFQQSGTCDDCGGGGGGGIVSVLSVTSNIDDRAVFSVNGAIGGICPICNGEAGGGVGELQISGGYVGEFCDGFDNDFDDQVDEGFADLACPGMSKPACFNGVPQQCTPDVPACQGPVTDSRSRFAVILDTSGSMLGTLGGVPTFGDGSIDHPGRDHNANMLADDSRLFKAKTALNQVIAGYPNIDFALARYHQDTSVNRSCQLAHNFECNAICCSYDNPTGNTPPAPNPACSVNGGTSGNVVVLKNSPGDECVNYAGNCGPPRRGADVVVGFGADINNHLMWLDGKETSFDASTTEGAYCNFAGGGDCELRGTGPTPLANSLNAVEDYLTPIKACDVASTGGCRKYNVILLTDGAESCQGNPVAAATALRNKGINTYVVGFSTLPSESAQLNAIALAGGTQTAFLVGSDDALANALATIVSNSIVFETCNNLDDDCDTLVDEGFAKGGMCDNGQQGICRSTGTNVCRADGAGVQCNAPAVTPGTEPPNGCNNVDDDCDGKIDEGVTGCNCIPQGESCNNMDDDCDLAIDENLTRPCGTGVCQGVETCTGNNIWTGCTAPMSNPETCDGADQDCDGVADGFTEACSNLAGAFPLGDPRNNPGNTTCPAGEMCPPTSVSPGCLIEGPALCLCHPGIKSCPVNGNGMFGDCTGELGPTLEVCNGLDDDCDGTVDEGTDGADCSTNCGTGATVCMNGTISCTSTTQPTDDTCDNNDDDCDGSIDEDYVSSGACGQGPPATVCMGVEQCVAGVETCVGEPVGVESCNCDDDDCDTRVDENVTCGGGASCISCQCAQPCQGGEFPCPSGKACSNGFCIADPCFGMDCPPMGGVEQTCVVQGNDGVCVDSCSLVSCNSGLVCQPSSGDCLPDNCASFPEKCTADQNCVAGVCVSNPCANVDCPIAEYCSGGQCFGSCAGVECPDGQRCRMGTCQTDPCGEPCPFGQVCNDATGTCGTNPCKNVICQAGQWCDPNGDGQCADDPCVGTTCPDPAQQCRGGTCDDPVVAGNDAGPEEYI